MADEDFSLDSLMTTSQPSENKEEKEETTSEDDAVSLEDEFAALLNSFVKQDGGQPQSQPASQNQIKAEPQKEEGGLDSFLTTPSPTSTSTSDDALDELSSLITPAPVTVTPENGGLDAMMTPEDEIENNPNNLKPEEKELASVFSKFQDGMGRISQKKNLKLPTTDYKEEQLKPNYKPSIGKKIAQYLLSCWDVISKYDPETMKKLSKDAKDEEYLNFAQSLNDANLSLVIVLYVEILVNLESCEDIYEQKKALLEKNRIKKELYDEYMELQRKKALFIEKLKAKKFPINEEKLIGNYFRAAQKDPMGAFDALVKNPAMFSPIEFEKIHPKFFGLIKVTPEDGIKANQKIGEFIKNLKV